MTSSFDQLEKAASTNSQVQLRGFAHQTDKGAWILSEEPHLKSCCIGSKSKAQTQVRLDKEFVPSSTTKALLVEGRLVVQTEGESVFYTLLEAKTIPSKEAPWATLSFAILILAASFLAFCMRKRLAKFSLPIRMKTKI